MADSLKISELPPLTTATDDDVLAIVDQPGTGFAATKKITQANLLKDLAITDTLASKANAAHTHAQSDVSGLTTALASKSDTGHTHTPSQVNLGDVPNVDATARANHTATQSADTIIDGSSNHVFTAANDTKLAGIDVGATQNATNAQLRDRSTHTGTQTSATIADFTEAVQDAVADLLAAGTAVTLNYDEAANSLTITGTGGGGGGLDAEAVRDAIGVALIGSGLIAVTVNDAADTITISTTATQNSTDAALRDRGTHTGTQAQSTITNRTTDLAAKAPLASPAFTVRRPASPKRMSAWRTSTIPVTRISPSQQRCRPR